MAGHLAIEVGGGRVGSISGGELGDSAAPFLQDSDPESQTLVIGAHTGTKSTALRMQASPLSGHSTVRLSPFLGEAGNLVSQKEDPNNGGPEPHT